VKTYFNFLGGNSPVWGVKAEKHFIVMRYIS